MKMNSNHLLKLAAIAVAVAAGTPQTHAASQTWSGNSSSNGNWSTVGNWAGGAAPGSTTLLTNGDTATFNAAIAHGWGTSGTPVVIDSATQNIKNLTFTTAADNFFVGSTGGNKLLLTSAGTIQIAAGLTSTNAVETINAPLQIQNLNTGGNGTYSINNNSANGSGAGAGTLNIGGGITGVATSGNNTVVTLGGTNTNSNTISGIIGDGSAGGTLGLSKSGAGVWVLSTANTYTGVTTITAGTLRYGANNALSSSTNVTVRGAADSTLDLNGFSGSIGTLALGGLGGTSATVIQVNTGAGTLTLGGDVTVANTGNPAAAASINGNVNLGGVERAFTVNDSTGTDVDLNVNAVLSGTASGIKKAGTGTMLLSQANTFGGAQSEVVAGTLRFGANNAINNTSLMQIRGSGSSTLDLNGYNGKVGNLQLGGLGGTASSVYQVATGTGTLTVGGSVTYDNTGNATATASVSGKLDLGGATRTFNIQDSTGAAIDMEVSAAISNGGITKNGTGTLALSGTNTYSGLTTVSAGTLIVNGTLGSGGVTVASGATLGGNITAGGTTTIQSGGTLSVGNSPGTGNFATLSLAGTTLTQFNANPARSLAGTDYDTINITTGLTYGGELRLTFDGTVANDAVNPFDLFAFGTLVPTGDFSAVSIYNTGGLVANLTNNSGVWTGLVDLGSGQQSFTFTQSTGDLMVTVPEPATWALMAAGLTIAMVLRRRARQY